MTIQQIERIFRKTAGYCNICAKQLTFSNYGKRGRRGAWHIDHSRPKSRGGTDHANNLQPACIKCNEDKGNRTTRTARRRNGHNRSPLRAQRKSRPRLRSTK
jgi:5-methylcytosine-specific restriction endonuclease McrA